ncbi:MULTISPECIES: GerMN domain-containing protein [unclassified Paenibacillus]|uniref:GerMN domain-containing protein n=1 Tax=unclassified Paenibacillus TaxID=185978 RepID=UPI001C1067E1|nr:MULTISPECIES: GerMN domain-containing protein [unclassified Paenibacillus]MBU5442676.1 GerMN domain-containing protein [Paenibacillus sp. MSJ-34]CAH0122208.1 hypothetical protein PAE9249_04755 [Paenibacillus sp. CECT 9249]
MRKIVTLSFVLLLIAAVFAGCGAKTKQQQGAVEPPPLETANVHVYFTDDQLMELTEKSVEISYESPDQKYMAALQALQHTDDPNLISLWAKAEFLSADNKEGALTVDMNIPAEARLGAPGEELAVNALLQTMFQFDEVQSIELLVDGQKVESLMGHVDLQSPFQRN